MFYSYGLCYGKMHASIYLPGSLAPVVATLMIHKILSPTAVTLAAILFIQTNYLLLIY